MFTFEKRDDGLLAVHAESGRPVAHIDTQSISETNDPRLKVQERKATPIPKDKWRVHFTAYRFTPAELAAFVQELAAQG